MVIELRITGDKLILLTPVKDTNSESNSIYALIDQDNKPWMKLQINGSSFIVLQKSEEISESLDDLNAKLDQLLLNVIESEQSGTENTETVIEALIDPYDPDKIKVSSKQFSIKLIKEMIDDEDIDLNPDFQRNFVWNSAQKSRLIESILLRIPLPMFYFSEDDEGRLVVIDGLQRLTTINEFMNNKFPLSGLEYLNESCEGCYYKEESGKKALEAKYFRWFNQTQISSNVIDPSSPTKVKYDIFRRINTGGKPLNNQEIRNCLAGAGLRETLKKMVNLSEFKEATDWSIKPTRMDDQEVALRFILFQELINEDRSLDNYTGYIEQLMDDITERLVKKEEKDLEHYVQLFSNAMKNARYLFGHRFAFRKIQLKDIEPGAHKQLINKALFVSWSVLLSNFNPVLVEEHNMGQALLQPLAKEITEDQQFLYYLSSGTNGKANIRYAFMKASMIIQDYLK